VTAANSASTITNLVLGLTLQNTRIDWHWIRFGLDPSHLSFRAVAHHLIGLVFANMNFVNFLALVGAALYVVTQLVRTIVPLRVIGIFSNIFFIAYGALAGVTTTLFLYLVSLPINIIRLRQMLKLVEKARVSSRGDLSMDWLRPYMSPRKFRKGEVLFHKGDVANEMLLTVTGRFLVVEINIEIPPGRLIGELGFIAPENRRTQTVSCIEDGNVLTISYEKLLELYFQNPEFGYYFLRLIAERLIQDITRLEGIVAANKAAAIRATNAALRHPVAESDLI
jgi:CRP-like cAMP-binding protein